MCPTPCQPCTGAVFLFYFFVQSACVSSSLLRKFCRWLDLNYIFSHACLNWGQAHASFPCSPGVITKMDVFCCGVAFFISNEVFGGVVLPVVRVERVETPTPTPTPFPVLGQSCSAELCSGWWREKRRWGMGLDSMAALWVNLFLQSCRAQHCPVLAISLPPLLNSLSSFPPYSVPHRSVILSIFICISLLLALSFYLSFFLTDTFYVFSFCLSLTSLLSLSLSLYPSLFPSTP